MARARASLSPNSREAGRGRLESSLTEAVRSPECPAQQTHFAYLCIIFRVAAKGVGGLSTFWGVTIAAKSLGAGVELAEKMLEDLGEGGRLAGGCSFATAEVPWKSLVSLKNILKEAMSKSLREVDHRAKVCQWHSI